jgi:hypothetical protein
MAERGEFAASLSLLSTQCPSTLPRKRGPLRGSPGIHCRDRSRAGAKRIRTISRQGGHRRLGGLIYCIANFQVTSFRRSVPRSSGIPVIREGPIVRIRLPPAESPLRTSSRGITAAGHRQNRRSRPRHSAAAGRSAIQRHDIIAIGTGQAPQSWRAKSRPAKSPSNTRIIPICPLERFCRGSGEDVRLAVQGRD